MTLKEKVLLSFPSELIAVKVALKSPINPVLPVITPVLFMLKPEASPVAVQLVGFREAGTCKLIGFPVVRIASTDGADHMAI